jgi:hypothetical protein
MSINLSISLIVSPFYSIEKARCIARTFGVENEKVFWMEQCACHIKDSTGIKVFQTPTMTIVVGIDTLEMSITKRENDNPVVLSDAKGEVFRYNGEFRHLWDEINSISLDAPS